MPPSHLQPGQTVGASVEPVHPDDPSHFTKHARARADRLEAPDAAARATAMPWKDMTRRTDADQPRRTRPRLAITARPEPRHDLRSLLDTLSWPRSTYHRRAPRQPSTDTMTRA